MAILKRQYYRKNSSGSYDQIMFETSADIVKMTDGKTVQDTMATVKNTASTAKTTADAAKTAASNAQSAVTAMDTRVKTLENQIGGLGDFLKRVVGTP